MRRFIGIVLLVLSVLAGIVLLATDHLGSPRLIYAASGGTPSSRWEVTGIAFIPNWWLAAPLALCFVVGLLCALLPERR
jgi:hypothetical protein